MVEHVLVEPRVTDNSAYSAWEALTRLGFAETLLGVRRALRWTLRVAAPEKERSALQRVLETCDVLVNPNKEALSFRAVPDVGEGDVIVAVSNLEDGVAATTFSILRERFGLASLESLDRTQLWILTFRNGDRDVARAAADALLVNLHFQTYEILSGDVGDG